MKILFIGDIFGRSGREALEKHLPELKDKHDPDIVICNGENAAHGNGINPKMCKEFYAWGVDVITTGNHVWDQREIIPYIQQDKNLIRPANYPPGTAGNGSVIFQTALGKKVRVINVMTRLFMDPLDCPFQTVDEIIKNDRLGQNMDAIFVDLHGETSSEKMSFGHYFDGRISAVIGTHTHIPTADAHVLEKGTAYQTDAGMTGDYNSVIGIEKQVGIHKFTKKTPGEKKKPASGEGCLCGAVINLKPDGLAQSIEPIRVGALLSNT